MVYPCFFFHSPIYSYPYLQIQQIVGLSLISIYIYRPSFRSYKPADESLKDLALPEPEIEEITDKVKDDLENEHKGVVMESLVCI